MGDNWFASVGAIVLKDDSVLLVRHTYGGAKGQLLNPSGFIKYGEMPYDALKREVYEETGVEINIKGLIAVRCSVKDWWLVFSADYVSGQPRSDNSENSEVFFMPCEEAINRVDVTDATKTLIKLAKKGKYLSVNEEYASIASSDGRMMFSVM
ncbi:MAG: NUDIX hydrolase [Clostridiales bacterium]|jgi:ADP-ribose pyrophosphatase YjhB (NUDIX family)|nr:NUDIX hydrolase [Clostridiales bacterium]